MTSSGAAADGGSLLQVRAWRRRLREMPRAHSDRFYSYLIRGAALFVVAVVLEFALPIAAVAAQGPAESGAASTSGLPTDPFTLALVIIWNGIVVGLVMLGCSAIFLARSVLRQFDPPQSVAAPPSPIPPHSTAPGASAGGRSVAPRPSGPSRYS